MSGMQELGDAIERRDKLIADLREKLAVAERERDEARERGQRDGERLDMVQGHRLCLMPDNGEVGEPDAWFAGGAWKPTVREAIDSALAARAQAPGGEKA